MQANQKARTTRLRRPIYASASCWPFARYVLQRRRHEAARCHLSTTQRNCWQHAGTSLRSVANRELTRTVVLRHSLSQLCFVSTQSCPVTGTQRSIAGLVAFRGLVVRICGSVAIMRKPLSVNVWQVCRYAVSGRARIAAKGAVHSCAAHTQTQSLTLSSTARLGTCPNINCALKRALDTRSM